MCCGCDTSYIVTFHIQCQASIYTLSLCRGHSWRVRLAKQETLTTPGHLVSHLVCRGLWMSTVVLYCWCHSDGASVLLYFTCIELRTCDILSRMASQIHLYNSPARRHKWAMKTASSALHYHASWRYWPSRIKLHISDTSSSVDQIYW